MGDLSIFNPWKILKNRSEVSVFSGLEVDLNCSTEITLEDGSTVVVDGHGGQSQSSATVMRLVKEGENYQIHSKRVEKM
jgi:hypothetical protein